MPGLPISDQYHQATTSPQMQAQENAASWLPALAEPFSGVRAQPFTPASALPVRHDRKPGRKLPTAAVNMNTYIQA